MAKAEDDFKFVVFFIIILGILWFASGAPERVPKDELDSPFIHGPTDKPGDRAEKIDVPRTGSIGEELERVEGEVESIERQIELIRESVEGSEYKDFVNFGFSSGAKESNPSGEYLEIRISSNAPGKIPVSGWKLSSITGEEVTIKGGSYLPRAGQVNTEQAVWAEPGNTLYVITGRSPLGVSFRTNMCTGYFAQFQNYTPRLPQKCPSPTADLPKQPNTNEGDRCIDLVEDLPRCRIYLGIIPGDVTHSCQTYLNEKLNYNGCVELHKNDKGFVGKEWYVYLGRSREMWREKREAVKLLDQNGRLLDTLTY